MSNAAQSGSPSQPGSSGKDTSKAKKLRKRRQRGIKSAGRDQQTTISKYLVKEESQELEGRQLRADPAQETTDQPVSLATTAGEVDEVPESSSGSTAAKPPTKAVKEVKKREDVRGKAKNQKSKDGRSDDGASGDRSSGGRGERGRRAVTSQDGAAPVKRQIQQSIRDHFPVRRSGRRSKAELEKEAFERTAQRLRTKDESGLKVVDVEGKGRGVVSTRVFSRGELVCEYSGELISHEEAKRREAEYGRDPSIGCYMYYFTHKNKKLCVDATADNGRKGRLLNHSKMSANVLTRLTEVDSQPYLCLVAARDIRVGEQLEYDYGERAREALDSHPWLAT